MASNKAKHTVVLLGVGHTNAHVLRMWKMNPISDANLVCVSNFPVATYSGMMPGVLAGQYPVESMQIDLVRLCRSANARLILGDVNGLDVEKQELQFSNRPSLRYDQLSIGVGSVPTFSGVEVESDESLLAIKPMQTFLARLEERLDEFNKKTEIRVAIVGGGIGSIETAFCLRKKLIDEGRAHKISLVTRSARVGSGLSASTQKIVENQLVEKEVELITGRSVVGIQAGAIRLDTQKLLDTDIIIWSTGATAPKLLDLLPLEKDDRGFLSTSDTLQTLTSDAIYAVGDTGTIVGSETDKAGVFAVRQGPILWQNIRNFLDGARRMAPYHPQQDYLKLINTADGKSIAQRKGQGFYAKWCFWLKDRIDRKFMEMYQDYAPMPMEDMAVDTEDAMRCLGCGGKIGGQILSSVLSELEIPKHDDVVIGLEEPDDAAVIRTPGKEISVTTDFFASPLDDPYLTGRIAALNSASDCFVMGAQPNAALAIVQLPIAHPRQQLQVMRELMTGAVEELARMGATIVGGHSIEGPRLLAGFTVMGNQVSDAKTKGQLETGDLLVLSKPIGSGILLAAWMQCLLDGKFYRPLVDSMLQSNQIAIELAKRSDVSAMTDVTGFGLAGHLKEMLVASNKSAVLNVDAIPLLPGTREMLYHEVESTLAPDNRLNLASINFTGVDVAHPSVAPLFDPQTGGGILFGVNPAAAEEVLRLMHESGFEQATVIGEVVDGGDGISIAVS
ncbi:selenide, water dikinase SelD [Mariniblastus fucicola]|uniref:Selenide, water dikinase n=1 Tax=Mariniblastus fucicola TaxID=980251 RepID=A0A5B9PDC1_9BACT|nr:selenide, water dikinase SelD [Mariniblastus fucicola]QEG23459.1 Selenide, water dikinase [Mariniblastus fucicola]